MQYLLLIYDRETDWKALAEKDKGAMFQEYGGVKSARCAGYRLRRRIGLVGLRIGG